MKGYTFPAQKPNSRIDFIFMKKINDLNIDTSYVVMDQPYSDNHYCSDHYGVMTILKSK